MIDVKTNLSSAVKAEKKTLSLNFKRSMINEESKQITQIKTFHNFLISENTSNSETVRIEADEERRQAKTTKKFLNQLHSKQTLKKKNSITESEQFANNEQENEDQDDKFDTMMLETSEIAKSNDFRRQIYEKIESYLTMFMMKLKNVEMITQLNHLNEQIKNQNIKNEFSKKSLKNFFIKIFIFIAHFELIKDLYEALQRNSNDDDAREILIKINQTLIQINERHDYFQI
jgi:signal recognition particle GTPase